MAADIAAAEQCDDRPVDRLRVLTGSASGGSHSGWDICTSEGLDCVSDLLDPLFIAQFANTKPPAPRDQSIPLPLNGQHLIARQEHP